MYLWCANCYHAHLRSRWEVKGAKYGVCPSCGRSAYKSTTDWEIIAVANGYPPIPSPHDIYPIQPLLF